MYVIVSEWTNTCTAFAATCSLLYCFVIVLKRSLYPINTCVFTVCVGRSSEFNWRWTRPITWVSLTPPPPLPSPLSIQSTDINTDLYSFAQCERQQGERREKGSGRTGRDRVYQIVLARGLLFALGVFSAVYICYGELRQLETNRAL